jgi:hypothetical protein
MKPHITILSDFNVIISKFKHLVAEQIVRL